MFIAQSSANPWSTSRLRERDCAARAGIVSAWGARVTVVRDIARTGG
jgi:hypothetical protein